MRPSTASSQAFSSSGSSAIAAPQRHALGVRRAQADDAGDVGYEQLHQKRAGNWIDDSIWGYITSSLSMNGTHLRYAACISSMTGDEWSGRRNSRRLGRIEELDGQHALGVQFSTTRHSFVAAFEPMLT